MPRLPPGSTGIGGRASAYVGCSAIRERAWFLSIRTRIAENQAQPRREARKAIVHGLALLRSAPRGRLRWVFDRPE